MRLEAIEKEANLYDGEGTCYVHAEQVHGSQLKMVTNGDPNSLFSAAYCLTLEVAGMTNMKPTDVWKSFIKVYKKHGSPKFTEI